MALAESALTRVPVLVTRAPFLDGRAPHAMEAVLARAFSGPTLLLDAPDASPLSAYAFVAADPCGVLTADATGARLRDVDGRAVAEGDLFSLLKRVLAEAPAGAFADAPPFQGGYAGILSYDAGRLVECIPETAVDDRGLPFAHLAFFDTVLAWNRKTGEAWAIARDAPRALSRGAPSDRLDRVLAAARAPDLAPEPWRAGALEPGMTRAEFEARVARARELVYDGDVYQVNLSHRFTAPFEGDVRGLYAALRRANSAPFAGFYDARTFQVLSSSPERLVRVRGRVADMRPIAGTRPRGADAEEDARLAAELAADKKERAEHVMLVDLARNDLGRVAAYGSVRVTDHMTVESYMRVHHLVSGVEGRLRDDVDAVDVIRACFPGGTITGAPKVRAMELIEDLEPVRRHAYTGALGYFTPGGDVDLNILIRTLTVTRDADDRARVDLQVGAGIVSDSAPDREYAETLAKARAMQEALEASSP